MKLKQLKNVNFIYEELEREQQDFLFHLEFVEMEDDVMTLVDYSEWNHTIAIAKFGEYEVKEIKLVNLGGHQPFIRLVVMESEKKNVK